MIGLGINLCGMGRVAFSPLSLFAAAEKGVWFEPSLATCFTDAGRTTPTTVGGACVGVTDLSGNGKHATFANATLEQDASGFYYISHNGTTTGGSTAAIDFTGTDKITVWAGVRKTSDAATGSIAELSSAISNNGTFDLQAPNAAAATNYQFRIRGTSLGAASVATPFAAGSTHVLCAQGSIGTSQSLRVNGAVAASGASVSGTGTFGNYVLYIGRRGGVSLPFNGRLYAFIVRGALSTASQISDGEAYANSRTGAY